MFHIYIKVNIFLKDMYQALPHRRAFKMPLTLPCHAYETAQLLSTRHPRIKKTSSLQLGDKTSVCYDCVSCNSANFKKIPSGDYVEIGDDATELCRKHNFASYDIYEQQILNYTLEDNEGRSGKCYVWKYSDCSRASTETVVGCKNGEEFDYRDYCGII